MHPLSPSLPAVAALVAAGAAAPDDEVGPLLDRHLPRLVELIREGVDRAEPYVDPEVERRLEGDTFFRGHYDWHSDVHAHWALLSIARVTGEEELSAEVLARLTPEVLEAERALLADPRNASFKLPYGQAWLLLLLDELSRHEGRDTEALRAFRGETEARLVEFLRERDLDGRPADPEREVVPNANYRSWLFGFWMLQLSGPVTPGVDGVLAELYAERVEPLREVLLGPREESAYDFLHLPGLLALVDRTGSTLEEPAPLPSVEDLPDLPAEFSLRNTHILGHELTRIWPLALAAAGGDGVAREGFQGRIQELFARSDAWETDYTVVSHWVPQFLWMGLWLELGRP